MEVWNENILRTTSPEIVTIPVHCGGRFEPRGRWSQGNNNEGDVDRVVQEKTVCDSVFL